MSVLLIVIFALGYLAIVFEHALKLNKSATALLTGVLCWTAYVLSGHAAPHTVQEQLAHHLGSVSQILFFLLAAMTIVEIIDAHDGFELITAIVRTKSRRKLLVTIAIIAFFLSAVLDNLTTAIVMTSLVRGLVSEERDRKYYGGMVIIAANAGGVWSPIGDVTTTMLWVGEQITAARVIKTLIVPSIVSVIIPMLWIGWRMKGEVRQPGRAATAARAAAAVAAAKAAAEASRASAADDALEAPLNALAGLTTVTLSADDAAVGKTLAQLNLRARTGASVVTISRTEKRARDDQQQQQQHQQQDAEHVTEQATVVPTPTLQLLEGDVLSLAGAPETIGRAIDLLVMGQAPKATTVFERRIVLAAGVTVLLLVPVFKTVTHLPPVMGILLGLGVLWLVTEIIHKQKSDEGRGALSAAGALQRVDAPSVLFFLGILLAISALESDGSLGRFAAWMDHTIGNVNAITLTIGLSSSVVDNVPLVAAAQGMYSRAVFPTDHHFWLFLAYCAGTGGSILIIGSAAGIAVMGSQRITFGWYLKRLALPALLGYAAGALTYLAMNIVG